MMGLPASEVGRRRCRHRPPHDGRAASASFAVVAGRKATRRQLDRRDARRRKLCIGSKASQQRNSNKKRE